MNPIDTSSVFQAKLLRPANTDDDVWAFIILPKDASAKLPRRGRTSIRGSINNQSFQATLEPDGQQSHWLRIDKTLLETAGVTFGDLATFEITAVEIEPEPAMPADFQVALAAAPQAREVWENTSTLAHVDWIHWITTAKQDKTRAKRINEACDKLASGQKRVCCFDPSGFYSKALSAPKAAD
ncbi:MAG: hypothetical protein AUK35_05495 [Zetaproteobacteria bacterium CG2_30_46_52]|nr:MAG: hypothetical protein AUK35_05495 [Zetaproteobacteria bacterium CG2_30_46_52]